MRQVFRMRPNHTASMGLLLMPRDAANDGYSADRVAG